ARALRLDPAPAPPPARPDERRACSAGATARLALMLGGHYHDLVPEWLGARGAGGGPPPPPAPPPRPLPACPARGPPRAERRPAILAVLARRGEWLANQSPDWSYALG